MKMMQAASKQRPMCGCARCDKHGRIKRKVRRAQRARERETVRCEIQMVA